MATQTSLVARQVRLQQWADRIKALLWEGDGFLLMYKRLDNVAF